MNEKWQQDQYVKNWLENLKSERTVSNYKERFPKWLEWIKQTPTQIIKSRLEHLTTQDLQKRRYWEKQLVKFTRHLETLKDDKGKRSLSTWSIKGIQTCIQSFFSHNGVRLEFARKELDVEPAPRETVEKEWIPSNEDVRMLYKGCKSARDRSILLTLYQSGFSEVDVSNMRIEDFNFYDKKGNWQLEPYKDVYHAKHRAKTNIIQKTCISREAIEDIRVMLQSRQFPQKGFLFVSQKGEQFTPRFINNMLKGIVETHLSYKQAEWKTKHLRDSFMSALRRAKIPTELKSVMVGHKRSGAKDSYKVTEIEILEAYDSAFKYLSVNGVGSSRRKIEQLEIDFKQKYGELAELIANLTTENKRLTQIIEGHGITLKKFIGDMHERLTSIEAKQAKKHKEKHIF
jgi:site-specific recombinase XerD